MAREVNAFVRAMGRAGESAQAPLGLRYGIVSTTPVEGSPTLAVTISGVEVGGLSRLTDVAAVAGDRVAVLAVGGDLLVIGVVAT